MVFDHVRLSLAVIVILLSIYAACDERFQKRILLTDPSDLQQLINNLQGEIQTLKAKVETQTSEIASLKQELLQPLSGGGSTFVRWGRTDCPAHVTELVYSGYAGGSWYAHYGAAADQLCLPPDPEWLNTTVVPDDYTGRLYGAEYESHTGHTLFGSKSQDEEIPCAVCRSTSFVSSVMIPARTTCYSGWTKAYGGSLASGYYGHYAATEYVCVDEHAQPVAGGADRDDDGVLFFGVKAFCGSLRCPPYEQDKYITCVVCMK
ncbi:short-chain collagen C4-like [Ylistrum balloti]|uniref:short-chain collagen C4-like n=1 Tax=Ylistrum balloti TaxID=509963 RepID=UPI002905857C|nr:short-chain collagen C4-like [Ylistrum balloti]